MQERLSFEREMADLGLRQTETNQQEVSLLPPPTPRGSIDYMRWIQNALNRVMGLKLAVDGKNGPLTQSAIRRFQQQQQLLADGIVGPSTEKAIVAALEPSKVPNDHQICPMLDKPIKEEVCCWGRYKSRVDDLPPIQKEKMIKVGDAIRMSHQSGCRPVKRVEIYGYADRDNPVREMQVSSERARIVQEWLKNYVGPAISAKISWADPKGLGTADMKIKQPQTEEQRMQNRRVQVVCTIDDNVSNECQGPFKGVRNISDYIELVKCVERAFPEYGSRRILSLLRQIYYGNEDWSKDKKFNWAWPTVIPCGHSIPDPRPKLSASLHSSLQDSQVLRTGDRDTDIGHLFTGLEAMFCPNRLILSQIQLGEYNIFLPSLIGRIMNMSNEEFATWGADLASAVARKLIDEQTTQRSQPWENYIAIIDSSGGINRGAGNQAANDEDLRGDIDSYAVRMGLIRSHPCYHMALKQITTISTPISKILIDYYMPSGSMRPEWADRFRCFIQTIGGVIVGNSIHNRTDLIDRVSPRIYDVAYLFYIVNCKKELVMPIFDLKTKEPVGLRSASREITDHFLNWLERQL